MKTKYVIGGSVLLILATITLILGFSTSCGFLPAILPSYTAPESGLKGIKLPPGFSIELYAGKISGARSLTQGPKGIVFVGSRGDGKVYAITDMNGDFKVDEVITIASGLNNPNGVAFRDGDLYVSEISRVIKFTGIERTLKSMPKYTVVNDRFPKDEHHGWKFIAFGPDGKLYVPVGAPCNICYREDKRYSSIMRMNADGSDLEIYAHGIRNTVGFDWNPDTKELWFTENGRDRMGDDVPPDELNRAPVKDMHYGFPFCHGDEIKDPEFGKDKNCADYTKPERLLAPHTAALGMRFYNSNTFPEKYRNGIFIAEHGSWNRSEPIGYRVMFVKIENNKAVSYEVFAEGWLKGGNAWGRPVDVLVMADGSLLVSDDKGDAVYRISYKEK